MTGEVSEKIEEETERERCAHEAFSDLIFSNVAQIQGAGGFQSLLCPSLHSSANGARITLVRAAGVSPRGQYRRTVCNWSEIATDASIRALLLGHWDSKTCSDCRRGFLELRGAMTLE